jgi:cytochrome c
MSFKTALKLGLMNCTALCLVACGDTSSITPQDVKAPVTSETGSPESVTPAPKIEAKAPITSETAQAALLKRGKIVWFKCRSCHELSVDGPHKVGPNLNGIIGAQAAKKEGFVYSKPMVDAGIVWDDASLDAFVTKPTTFVKGTKMAFVGIKKEYDRKALIEYIRQEAMPPE